MMKRLLPFHVHEALYPPLRDCLVCGRGHTNAYPYCGYNCNAIAWEALQRAVQRSLADGSDDHQLTVGVNAQ